MNKGERKKSTPQKIKKQSPPWAVIVLEINFASRGEYCSPLSRSEGGTPAKPAARLARNINPLLPGYPTSYPTENTFGGDPNEAPSQNQRFCDGVPVVHFGVPGQKFIIFDWGKFREPHSGLTFPKQKKCLPPSFGFPPKSFPLAGNPPFRGTPSALGHERRHCGTFAVPQIMPLAMRPLREEMAHC